MSESNIQRAAQIELSKVGVTTWRNNVAKAWVGELFRPTGTCMVRIEPGDVVLRHARPLAAGLCVGSTDLIGIRTVQITPDHVGTKIGQFCASEAKTPTGRVTTEQQNFMDFINQAGGVAGVFRSPEDAVRIFG